MRRIRSLFVIVATAVMLAFGAIGCGNGDDDCASDHDCDDDYVCEPSGCELSCTNDTDCPAAEECAPRRVEEGSVCTPR